MIKIDLEKIRRTLYSGVIADILDELGYRNQAMGDWIRPHRKAYVVAGPAFTILATNVYQVPENPYELELKAVDSVGPGEVIVATSNGSTRCGFWGELLTTRAMHRGAVGAVIDGMTRDSLFMEKLDFPFFVRGYNPLDSKGRIEVIDYAVPIECGGVRVCPGDFIFGDNDGIVVIPKAVTNEVLVKALEKVKAENIVREELKKGKSAKEVYEEYGIL